MIINSRIKYHESVDKSAYINYHRDSLVKVY